MRTYEFIDIELRKQAIEELKNNNKIKEQSKLIDVLETNSIGKELEAIYDYVIAIKQHDEFNNLKNFTFILDLLKKVDELEMEISELKEIERRMKYNPKNKIFPFLWIKYKVSFFEDDEYLDFDYAKFINNIINNYDYLINLEDFFFETQVLFIKPLWETWDKSIFSSVFKMGANKFPHKHIFKKKVK